MEIEPKKIKCALFGETEVIHVMDIAQENNSTYLVTAEEPTTA